MLPTRRRNLQGPLHPLHREPPSSTPSTLGGAPFTSSPLPSSDECAPSSVFLAPTFSRKRHFATANASPTLSSAYNTQYLETDMDARSVESYSSISGLRQPTRQMSHSTFAEPAMSNPLRAPQGEFSFQAPAPSQAAVSLSSGQVSMAPASVETSSMAFAKLAQAQRAQQEAQRQSASGQNAHDEHTDGPPVKRRRGVASVIVDGALSAAIYTGAAAVTAYSLWSSWGRKADEEEGERNSAREKLPPGGLDEPPPPYIDQRDAATAGPSKTPMSPVRPAHIYVSSRRRRPAFQSTRSTRTGNTPKRKGLPVFDSAVLTAPSTSTAPIHAEDDEMDEDDLFARMQSKMSSLIEEGTRALHSQADLDDEEPQRPALTPSRSDPLGWSQQAMTPSISHRSASSRYEMGMTPSLQQSPPFLNDAPIDTQSVFASPRSTQLTLARSQNSPYSRIPRLGAPPQSPSTRRRL